MVEITHMKSPMTKLMIKMMMMMMMMILINVCGIESVVQPRTRSWLRLKLTQRIFPKLRAYSRFWCCSLTSDQWLY